MRPADAQLHLEPYFAAARDVFAGFSPVEGVTLERVGRVKFVVDARVHDTPRHFAKCRDDGKLVVAAPELCREPLDRVIAILAHELGHAADFLYPASFWLVQRGKPAAWKPPTGKGSARELGRWNGRSDDEVEFWADAVAELVTGASIRYAGPCMLQTFGRGAVRPEGLR